MEDLGEIEDHELSFLSWKFNPNEFDRIALQFLRIKRVSDSSWLNIGTVTKQDLEVK